MNSINVKVDHAHTIHRFTLLRTSPKPRYPSLAQLCEALIHHLKLPFKVDQLTSPHPPIHIWYLDGDGKIRLRNNHSVREALRKTPHTLRLRLRYRHSKSSKSETSTPSHPPSRSDTVDEPYIPSATTLLRLLNHAENHAMRRTVDALEDLQQSMLKYSGDAAKLANARDRLSRLYCSFLRRLIITPVDKVHETLEAPLLVRLETILEDEDISEGTIRAARRAVRAICDDPQALIHMRTRWAVIAGRAGRAPPPSTAPPQEKPRERPIKHYQNLLQKLIQAGGGDVKATYSRLMKYVNHHDAFEKAEPGITRDLCVSVEKIVFHVIKCHRKDGKFVVQSHAARALAASVGRKFSRAGFHKRFVVRASGLTRALVDDPTVVELAYGLAKKKSGRDASAYGDSGVVGRLADEDDDELFGGERDVDDTESTTTSTTTSTASSTSDDDDVRGGGSKRSRSGSRRSRSVGKGSRSGSRSVSKKSGPASGSRAASGSHGRSRSASGVVEGEASRKSRGRSRSRSRASSRRSGRSESRASLKSIEEDADEMMRSRQNSRESLSEGARLNALEDGSSVHSSEDRGKIYRYHDNDSDDGSGFSNDTSRSQWARVQMEKEKERLREMYLRDQVFSNLDGAAQVDMSKRLRHAKDSIARRSVHDVPNPSERGSSITTDEPVRRPSSMRSGRSPRGRRKSKSPFRKNFLRFREVGPREGVVR